MTSNIDFQIEYKQAHNVNVFHDVPRAAIDRGHMRV